MSATDPLDAALRRLHLPAVRQQYPELAAQAVAENWSYPEYLERLAQAELVRRQERRLAQATRRAGFPFLKTLEEFDFTFQASLQRKALGPYLGPELVSGGRNLILWAGEERSDGGRAPGRGWARRRWPLPWPIRRSSMGPAPGSSPAPS